MRTSKVAAIGLLPVGQCLLSIRGIDLRAAAQQCSRGVMIRCHAISGQKCDWIVFGLASACRRALPTDGTRRAMGCPWSPARRRGLKASLSRTALLPEI
jgi:hypothetical protein